MSKREVVLSLLEESQLTSYIPAGFFIHFDPKYHRGEAAIKKHIEYFHFTGMDFVKIQYENRFPFRPEIKKAEDWLYMPLYEFDFYEDQIHIAKKLVESLGEDSLVLMTLYSPFMCAGQTIGKDLLSEHLNQYPEMTKKGIEIITDSLLTFVRGCVAVGIDGFYHSTQGGETQRFEGTKIFNECIKPYDLILMEEIDRLCEFNILHICDYEGSYNDLTTFLDYPGHVVNASLQFGEKTLTPTEISEIFNRPFMGGLDRHGIITSGTHHKIREKVNLICKSASEKFILGADCTLPGDINWENIKIAIETAHKFKV